LAITLAKFVTILTGGSVMNFLSGWEAVYSWKRSIANIWQILGLYLKAKEKSSVNARV